ncbi:hypothetical protein NDU88_007122 [Pleurodeles waltl]|uniref:Uncharacterized protein n=1 Tax=Pleurodeles waltl TaxID=8319 RepID=A0AAV7NS59_PLEWA|nr:hypothetical protein NDU88_007122 [Pleurodeles waltl]
MYLDVDPEKAKRKNKVRVTSKSLYQQKNVPPGRGHPAVAPAGSTLLGRQRPCEIGGGHIRDGALACLRVSGSLGRAERLLPALFVRPGRAASVLPRGPEQVRCWSWGGRRSPSDSVRRCAPSPPSADGL